MRCRGWIAAAAVLAFGFSGPAAAIEPDDVPWDEIDRVLKENPSAAKQQTIDLEEAAPANAPGQAAATKAADTPPPSPPEQPVTAPVTAPAAETAAEAPAAAPAAAPLAAAANSKPKILETIRDPEGDSQPPEPVVTSQPPLEPPPVADAAPAVPAPEAHISLPLKAYLEPKASTGLKTYDAADRQALQQFYVARLEQSLWVSNTGFNPAAEALIAEIKKADDWGLSTADFKLPSLPKIGSGEFSQSDLLDAEVRLSLAAMQYAREARGDRIDEPAVQLSSYLDRKPQLVDRAKLLDALAATAEPGDYIRGLHPVHPQFERLRQKLIALRAGQDQEQFEKIGPGPKITPGQSNPQIALIRKRLKVAAPTTKPDGSWADENFYDASLAEAIKKFKDENGITPVTPAITTVLRNALNQDTRISEETLLANMEEWRWMPQDLGATHVWVNIPEFLVRVVKNDTTIHEERIVAGKADTQTPIFSDEMRTIVFQPPWNVPEGIKIKELLPALQRGNNPIERQGLVLRRNGRDIDPWDVDWSQADIRQYDIHQPPGEANVLGVVKFLFPNKHSVYLHDTPAKSLFNERIRTFSHGCMRVRNPVRLAEVLLAEDKGWDKNKIDDLVNSGPEDNNIALDKPLPVHVTYFTAWVDETGQVKTFQDPYGHEQRIKLGLQGRWNEIVKDRDHLLPPEDVPVARGDDTSDDGYYERPRQRAVRESRGDPRYGERVAQKERPRHQFSSKYSGFGDFMRDLLGGN